MKKMVIILAFLLVLPIATARMQSEDITIPRIRLGDYGHVTGPEMDSYVSVCNNYPCRTLKDVTVSIRILDADIYDSRNIDVKKKECTGTNFMTNIEHVEPGEYLVRITVYKDGIRRVKHRYITIE